MKRNKLLMMILVLGLLIGAVIFCLISAFVPIFGPCYIGNIRTYVFHRQNCYNLPMLENRSHFRSRQEAISERYRPCRKCKP